MMLSRMSGGAEEMSASFEMELPKTLIDEDGGAAGAEEAADKMLRRETASKMMQELSKAGDQTVEKETPEKEQPAELSSPEKCEDSKNAAKGKWKALMFDLEGGGEEQSAENNKNEREWGKENKKKEAQVARNTVQMERAVVAEESSSRAVARSKLKEKPEKQRGAKSGAQIRLRNQEKTKAQKELRVMGNAAEFRAERLPERESCPKRGDKLVAKPLRLRRCCLWQLKKRLRMRRKLSGSACR